MKELVTLAVLLTLLSCAPTIVVDPNAETSNPYYCEYMKEVCRESEEFERTYAAMGKEEQKEAENILNAYRYQCSEAALRCQGKK